MKSANPMTMRLKPNHFLVDQHGKPEAVVLSLPDYRRLLDLIEDREDAIALKHAISTSSGTISHAKLMERLKHQGLL